MNTDTNDLKKQFPFIFKWGQRMGSFEPYMEGVALEAKRLHLPANTVYIREGKAVTTDDISNDDIIQEWGLANKPSKESLKLQLKETVLRGEAYSVIESRIDMCETFVEAGRIKEILYVFTKGLT